MLNSDFDLAMQEVRRLQGLLVKWEKNCAGIRGTGNPCGGMHHDIRKPFCVIRGGSPTAYDLLLIIDELQRHRKLEHDHYWGDDDD